MMFSQGFVVFTTAFVLNTACRVNARSETPDSLSCVRVKIESGWLCGTRRSNGTRSEYASFRGVPYAKQPLRELRFQELQPAEPWDTFYDATTEGPICPQTDLFYGRLMKPQGMSEACIHANIHVPIDALPKHGEKAYPERKGLPILVFIHGGGFAYGSGDADLHGPEPFMARNIIVITFNYRLNVFGFLSLNTTSVPGNNGLRDTITLLRWVRRNAPAFGGDPDEVTLAGQSAGAGMTHLLTLSPVSNGLFRRAIAMSGVAFRGFTTTSPLYARFLATQLLVRLGINIANPDNAHRQLVELPLADIMRANAELQDMIGLNAFVPVVESILPNVTRVLDADPEELAREGRGRDIPLLLGFTDHECETFLPRFKSVDIMGRLKSSPSIALAPGLLYSAGTKAPSLAAEMIGRYATSGDPTIKDFVEMATDNYFAYPALYSAKLHATTGRATYLYRFSYEPRFSVLRAAFDLDYKGAGHAEDLTYIFQTHSVPTPFSLNDHLVRERMTSLFADFVHRGWFECGPVDGIELSYEDISSPWQRECVWLSDEQRDMIRFYDQLYNTVTISR